MPWIKGVAADSHDLFDQFRNYATGRTVLLGVSYSGTGNGTLTKLSASPAAILEDWTITCATAATDAGAFSVVGSVSGNVGTATVGEYFNGGGLFFIIDDGATDFAVNDEFTLDKVTYSGTGNGTITDIRGGVGGVTETWTLTCTSASVDAGDFSVVGSVSGSIGTASVAVPFLHSKLSFTINDGATDFVVNDAFTIKATQHELASLAEHWDEKEHDTTEITDGEVLHLAGPGISGTDDIHLIYSRLADNDSGDYYNWEIRGAEGYNSGNDRTAQPGISLPINNYYANFAMAFWFVVNGDRIITVVKVSTTYQTSCCGFILDDGLTDEYHYPLYIGACDNNNILRWSLNTDERFSGFFDPGNGGAYLKTPSKAWHAVYNISGSSGSRAGEAGASVVIKPWHSTYDSSFWGSGGLLDNTRESPSGKYMLYPARLEAGDGFPEGRNSYGVLDGVFWISGHGNVSENIETVGGVEHLVIQSVYRTDRNDYCAIALK